MAACTSAEPRDGWGGVFRCDDEHDCPTQARFCWADNRCHDEQQGGHDADTPREGGPTADVGQPDAGAGADAGDGCRSPCDPLAQCGCTDQMCMLDEDTNAPRCVSYGVTPVYVDCVTNDDCLPGNICLVRSGWNTRCHPLCYEDADCTGDGCIHINVDGEGRRFGVCGIACPMLGFSDGCPNSMLACDELVTALDSGRICR